MPGIFLWRTTGSKLGADYFRAYAEKILRSIFARHIVTDDRQ